MEHQQESRVFGAASLALGFAGFLPVPGVVASVLALVFGYLSHARSRAAGQEVSGLATAGIILGWVSIALFATFVVVYFVILGYPLPEIHRYRPDH